MTQAYPFEWKVLGFAQDLSARLAGEGDHTFLMILTGRGVVRSLQFGPSEGHWHQLTAELDRAGPGGDAYLVYDPFEGPEYTWLSWRRIERPTMERLIGGAFENADFVKAQPAPWDAPDLEPPGAYPASWGVMF